MCVAECVPNSTVCMGITSTGVGEYPGTNAYGTCGADGKIPAASTACPGVTVCRKNYQGIAVGCMECLGPNHGGNANGQADSRCTDNAGAVPGTTAYESCQANDTWPAAPTVCPVASPTCTVNAIQCNTCTLYDTTLGYYVSGPCTETRARAISNNVYGCSAEGRGTPTLCGGSSDCCSVYCYGSGPSVATCQ
jgi:hypothetical protein